MHREGLGGNFRKVAATDGTILALHVRRNSGQCLAQFLVRATDVRELVSSARVRTSPIGRVVNTATDATGPLDAIATFGTMR